MVATVWEGKGVVVTGRKLVGATNPLASGVPLQMHPLLSPIDPLALHGGKMYHRRVPWKLDLIP